MGDDEAEEQRAGEAMYLEYVLAMIESCHGIFETLTDAMTQVREGWSKEEIEANLKAGPNLMLRIGILYAFLNGCLSVLVIPDYLVLTRFFDWVVTSIGAAMRRDPAAMVIATQHVTQATMALVRGNANVPPIDKDQLN